MNDSARCDSTQTADHGTELVPLYHTMRGHAPELDRMLRGRDVAYVRVEYSGAEGRGGFDALLFVRADGSPVLPADGPLNVKLKATFRALLGARHPNWCQGNGSCGDFRWDLRADSLTHSHYTRGERNERTTLHGV